MLLIEGYHCKFEWVDQAKGLVRCVYCLDVQPYGTIDIARHCKTQSPERLPTALDHWFKSNGEQKVDQIQQPPWYQKAVNFSKAVLAQAPLSALAAILGDESIAYRTPEEIHANLQICKGCELFDGKVCTHSTCGCPLDEERPQWLSALSYKTHNCPLKKW